MPCYSKPEGTKASFHEKHKMSAIDMKFTDDGPIAIKDQTYFGHVSQ